MSEASRRSMASSSVGLSSIYLRDMPDDPAIYRSEVIGNLANLLGQSDIAELTFTRIWLAQPNIAPAMQCHL
jgi:hypothetical protein